MNYPVSNRGGYSPRHSGSNPEGNLDDYPAGHWEGSPKNPESSREDGPDGNSAGYSVDCPDNRPERNPGSNLPNNGTDNGPDHWESNRADSLPD